MEHLWAPWRMGYFVREKPSGCIFCPDLKSVGLEEKLILHVGERLLIMMNKYPYNNGHLLIAPRKHTGDMADLSDEEVCDLSRAIRESVSILGRAMNPHGFNLGMNLGACAGAGVAGHLHYHLVPRWEADTSFMTIVADARVMPEQLRDTYAKLAPLFEKLDEAPQGKS